MSKLMRSAFSMALSFVSLTTFAQTPKVVISQIYGGAGCGVAGCSTYKNDFIEIFNSGSAPQSLNGWSIQYAASTGTAWVATNLTNVTLQPGQYYLISQGVTNANGVNALPVPDASGTVSMSANAAKIALVNTTTLLSGACPSSASIVDFVGYGATTNCNEGGTNAPAHSVTTAILRAGNGCTDAGINSADFSVATPTPRNTSTAITPCASSLPVTFISFDARYREATGSVTLSWSTAQERNAREFVAERSADGKAWASVLQVEAAGNTSLTREYEATDTHLQQGVNLYRIRQVDLDGRSQYTGILSVNVSGKRSGFNVFPNPSTGRVHLSAVLPVPAVAGIRVTDISGRVVLQEQRVFDGGQAVDLDLSGLEKGTYFITISSAGLVKTEKVSLY